MKFLHKIIPDIYSYIRIMVDHYSCYKLAFPDGFLWQLKGTPCPFSADFLGWIHARLKCYQVNS